MKRIFYFNITYGCNSNCVFCYSHNTHHQSITFNEISSEEFFQYLIEYNVSPDDRVIINGGEPLLHSEIETILFGLMKFDCEVLVYTNGRLLNKFDFSKLSKKYRFIIPIHGYEIIHDRITGVAGSYKETLTGITALTDKSECLVDLKIIINKQMIMEDRDGKKLIESLKNVNFNNAIHITRMADTIVSVRNNCKTVNNSDAAYYTRLLYEYYNKKKKIIKIFDTCISELDVEDYGFFEKYNNSIVVYFKDKNQFREMNLTRNSLTCMENCKMRNMCMSAVDEYKVFECWNGKIYENLE